MYAAETESQMSATWRGSFLHKHPLTRRRLNLRHSTLRILRSSFSHPSSFVEWGSNAWRGKPGMPEAPPLTQRLARHAGLWEKRAAIPALRLESRLRNFAQREQLPWNREFQKCPQMNWPFLEQSMRKFKPYSVLKSNGDLGANQSRGGW